MLWFSSETLKMLILVPFYLILDRCEETSDDMSLKFNNNFPMIDRHGCFSKHLQIRKFSYEIRARKKVILTFFVYKNTFVNILKIPLCFFIIILKIEFPWRSIWSIEAAQQAILILAHCFFLNSFHEYEIFFDLVPSIRGILNGWKLFHAWNTTWQRLELNLNYFIHSKWLAQHDEKMLRDKNLRQIELCFKLCILKNMLFHHIILWKKRMLVAKFT